ncbi:Glutamyl-tRNA-Gln amidotransferase B subunit [Trametes versicolor FP-101664 SS1]|uniref:Glutamyl-tRNA-Gln amidotransferase B subunit n=1 Tax=Trametes versicolor (strain FP-101664) TaxID=717944 RepID=UPI00046224AF|nr:Glutamyl-tRNA-Gln amidotransferase B subunit [Trametes versicolor FP-101664 SS1]EIW61602.1 Glutamyl-tRNA-Gln amidotransferase B subunit [Trametes versicolor FP-101664 SS1]
MLAYGRARLITRVTVPNRHVHIGRNHKEDARWPGWELVVGIEVHAQIKSSRKLFSETLVSKWTGQNAHVSAFDAAFPGTLPRLNPKCVELGVRTAIALNADVQQRSAFDRKHYFYADLPSGYQITQQYAPIARNGHLRLEKDDIAVRIKQVQLEQDTGKSTFVPRNKLTAIDLNRAGMPLMEIVSEPDMRSPEEAANYVRTLQALLRSVGSSDGNMEQGSLRCDVNVSVNRIGRPPGTRCEIKNLNSVKNMTVAITCEAFRQIALLDRGAPVLQETRGFDEEKAETYALRSKEDAPDYRYMPDPNIPPLLLHKNYIDDIRGKMPELPDATRDRLLSQGLSERDVEVLMDVDSGREVGFDGELGRGAVAYFDEVSRSRDPKAVVNWITHELLGQLAFRHETFKQNPISAEQMGDLVDLVQSQKVTGTSGKTILRHMLSTHTPDLPSKIARDLQLVAVSDDGASLEGWCRDAIAALPAEADAVRRGNPNVVNKIMGHVMKASRGTAKAQDARTMLLKLL